MSLLKLHGGKLAVSLVIAAVFAWLLRAASFELIPKAGLMTGVRPWTLLAYFVLFSAVHVLRAARWSLLLAPIQPVSMQRVLATSFIGFAAIVLMPMRTGELVRAILIRKKGEISGWAATGTIGAERVIDGLVLSLVLLGGLATATTLDPLPDRIGNLNVSAAIVPVSAYIALGIFACAFGVMALFYFARNWARRMTLGVLRVFSKRGAVWIADRIEQITDGLHFLPNLRLTGSFVFLTVVYWLVNAGSTWLLAWGTGFHNFTYAEACVITGVLALGIMVPNAPGFFGAFQFSIFAGFAMFYEPELIYSAGAAYVFWVYVLQMLITALAAVAGALMLRLSPSEIFDSAPQTLDGEAHSQNL